MLPWLSIRENVMIPLKIVEPFRQDYARKRNGEFAERADALLAQVGLKGFADKRPWQLSGGMLQRASLCRALIHEPQLLLLDEPLEGLAPIIVEELLRAISRITRQEGLSAIIVEQHPQAILAISDQAVVLDRGSVVHHSSAQQLQAQPELIEGLLGVRR
jgi:ABC-type branched-subunit amino acid transport system ATPase component